MVIECFGGKSSLLGSPIGKTVGSDILGKPPFTFFDQALDTDFKTVAVFIIAPQRFQIPNVVAHMIQQ
ncbi:hypothetical protein [Cerasicoccus arenae]|uniref:hypothetical protein n=1 Tax=Cerasicoccus arenae TaxID=424488 RepID=UPI001E64A63F|nr:hypothetical protein [Cerasicoccus arenae]